MVGLKKMTSWLPIKKVRPLLYCKYPPVTLISIIFIEIGHREGSHRTFFAKLAANRYLGCRVHLKMVFYIWPLYHGTFCITTVHDFDVKCDKFDKKVRWARRSFGTFLTLPSSEKLRLQSRWYLNGDAMSNFRQLGHAQSWMGSKASFLEKAKTDHDRSTRIASDPIRLFPPNLRNRNLLQAGIMNP